MFTYVDETKKQICALRDSGDLVSQAVEKLALSLAHQLDQDALCEGCGVWLNAMDGQPIYEGYLCATCAKDQTNAD